MSEAADRLTDLIRALPDREHPAADAADPRPVRPPGRDGEGEGDRLLRVGRGRGGDRADGGRPASRSRWPSPTPTPSWTTDQLASAVRAAGEALPPAEVYDLFAPYVDGRRSARSGARRTTDVRRSGRRSLDGLDADYVPSYWTTTMDDERQDEPPPSTRGGSTWRLQIEAPRPGLRRRPPRARGRRARSCEGWFDAELKKKTSQDQVDDVVHAMARFGTPARPTPWSPSYEKRPQDKGYTYIYWYYDAHPAAPEVRDPELEAFVPKLKDRRHGAVGRGDPGTPRQEVTPALPRATTRWPRRKPTPPKRPAAAARRRRPDAPRPGRGALRRGAGAARQGRQAPPAAGVEDVAAGRGHVHHRRQGRVDDHHPEVHRPPPAGRDRHLDARHRPVAAAARRAGHGQVVAVRAPRGGDQRRLHEGRAGHRRHDRGADPVHLELRDADRPRAEPRRARSSRRCSGRWSPARSPGSRRSPAAPPRCRTRSSACCPRSGSACRNWRPRCRRPRGSRSSPRPTPATAASTTCRPRSSGGSTWSCCRRPNTLETEVEIVRKRVKELGTNLELKAAPPAEDAVDAGGHHLPRAAGRADARRQEQAQGAERGAVHRRGDLGAGQRHGPGRATSAPAR